MLKHTSCFLPCRLSLRSNLSQGFKSCFAPYVAAVIGMPLAASVALTPKASAEDLFEIQVSALDDSVDDLLIGSSSVIDLVEDVIKAQDDFEDFDGVAFESSMTWAGVRDAIELTSNADGTSIVLEFPIINFTRTFTGSDRDDVEEQIEDFIKEDGLGTYSDFLKALRDLTPVAALDGSPTSTTGQMGIQSFYRNALPTQTGYRINLGSQTDDQTLASNDSEQTVEGDVDAPKNPEQDRYVLIRPSARWSKPSGVSDGFDSTQYGVELIGHIRFNEVLSLSGSGFVTYEDIQGAEVFHTGVELGLPIDLVRQNTVANSQNAPTWSMTATPFALLGGSASVDTASGGSFYGVGGSLRTSLHTGPWTFTLGNQVTYYDSIEIEVDEYSFDPQVDQTLVINGLQVAYAINQDVAINAGLAYADYLEDAAVDDWWMPTVNVELGHGSTTFSVGYQGQYGDDFESTAVVVGFKFKH